MKALSERGEEKRRKAEEERRRGQWGLNLGPEFERRESRRGRGGSKLVS